MRRDEQGLPGLTPRAPSSSAECLTVFTKGGKVQTVPIVDPAFWNDLGRHILDCGAQPNEYLLPGRTVRPNRQKPGEKFVTELPRRADGRPRPAQVVVRLPSARGRRRATPDQRRADAQSTPHGRPACSRPHTRQPEGGPEATRPFLALDDRRHLHRLGHRPARGNAERDARRGRIVNRSRGASPVWLNEAVYAPGRNRTPPANRPLFSVEVARGLAPREHKVTFKPLVLGRFGWWDMCRAGPHRGRGRKSCGDFVIFRSCWLAALRRQPRCSSGRPRARVRSTGRARCIRSRSRPMLCRGRLFGSGQSSIRVARAVITRWPTASISVKGGRTLLPIPPARWRVGLWVAAGSR